MANLIAQIIVATHGDLACALLQVSESITGTQPEMVCVGLQAGEDVQAHRARVLGAMKSGHSALILVDVPGGTPWNIAATIAVSVPNVRVVSGVNLSMLLEVALSRRGLDIDQLAKLAHQTGIETITIAHTGMGK